MCVFVASGIQHTMHIHHTVTCSLPGSTIYFHIISWMAQVLKKLLNIKCVFWLSLQSLSNTFPFEEDLSKISKMYIGLHVKYPLFLSNFNETWIFLTVFRKYQISWKSVQWEPSCYTQTDGRTHMMKLIVAFRNFANAPKNDVCTHPNYPLI